MNPIIDIAYLVVQLHFKSSPAKRLVNSPRPDLVYLTGSSSQGSHWHPINRVIRKNVKLQK